MQDDIPLPVWLVSGLEEPPIRDDRSRRPGQRQEMSFPGSYIRSRIDQKLEKRPARHLSN